MPKDNKRGIRQHAGCCFELKVLQQSTERRFEDMNLFKKYVDDFICTVCGDPDEYLKSANSLHVLGIKKQLTLEQN